MLEVSVVDMNNKKVGSIELNEKIFGQTVNSVLLHEAVVMQLNNARQGTHCTKTKGFVRGGGKKPWKQKGTGRARAGSTRSPVWVGGGTIFGPLPRDYSYKMTRKKGRLAIYSALSSKVKDNVLVVVDSLAEGSGKTKEAADMLKMLNIAESTLVICNNRESLLYRGMRNLPTINIVDVRQLNVYELLRYKNLFISKEDIKTLMEVWS